MYTNFSVFHCFVVSVLCFIVSVFHCWTLNLDQDKSKKPGTVLLYKGGKEEKGGGGGGGGRERRSKRKEKEKKEEKGEDEGERRKFESRYRIENYTLHIY